VERSSDSPNGDSNMIGMFMRFMFWMVVIVTIIAIGLFIFFWNLLLWTITAIVLLVQAIMNRSERKKMKPFPKPEIPFKRWANGQTTSFDAPTGPIYSPENPPPPTKPMHQSPYPMGKRGKYYDV
jgi:hypothetical protein